ncbi:hypothetical protein [uncultured Hyphomicrobium sp.]|uniref:hypothetical protein n=1 Tax=uncultured Hyphomicrobium sp. TaxID=194373 RepID=UPI0025D2762D|nr:hypothetical protein [uncultured Hyphomicrobium sp.]
MIREIYAACKVIGTVAVACLSLGILPALAEPKALSVELNKLEPQGAGCRAYVVVQNDDTTAYKTFKLDLVLFQQDGVIGRRFAMDLAPLKAQKRTVKLFDLDNIACDKIGSFLINDVVECATDTGPVENCLAGVTVKSLTSVQLTK